MSLSSPSKNCQKFWNFSEIIWKISEIFWKKSGEIVKILFDETNSSTYAAQGNTPTGRAGYDIWLWYDDGNMDFLGFIDADDMLGMAYYYQSIGDQVYVRNLRGNKE